MPYNWRRDGARGLSYHRSVAVIGAAPGILPLLRSSILGHLRPFEVESITGSRERTEQVHHDDLCEPVVPDHLLPRDRARDRRSRPVASFLHADSIPWMLMRAGRSPGYPGADMYRRVGAM